MYDVLVDHPIDDPELVSYVRPELRDLLPELEKTHDSFTLLRDDKTKAKYLHQEPGEPGEAYESRLHRSTYTPVFRDAIRAFAGLLGNYQLNEPPVSMEDSVENVDLMGSSLSKFLNELDQWVLRDGGAAVLVEMPEEQQELTSALEEIEEARRPYLVAVRRTDIINWRTVMTGGREVVEQAVIRTVAEKESEEGKYGVELEPVYLVLTPGAWQRIRMTKDTASKWTMEIVAQGVTSLPVVPLAWYGATGSRFGLGTVPLVGLANLSIQHFQLRSDLAELIHKLSMPVPVRKGATLDEYGRPPAIVIGPNTAIDLPIEGDFSFAEPTGGSLAQHQEEITHLEGLMDRSTLTFMYGEGGNRTATEAMLQGSQVQAQVATLIENKESMFDLVIRLWTAYTSEKFAKAMGLEVSDNLIQRPLESAEIQSYLNLFADNAISHQTLLEELKRGHVLSQDLDVEEEMERVAEEKQAAMDEAMEQAMAMAEMGGPEDDAPPPKGDGPQAAAAKKKPDAKTQDSQKEMKAQAGDTAPKGAAARASALKNTPNKKAQKK